MDRIDKIDQVYRLHKLNIVSGLTEKYPGVDRVYIEDAVHDAFGEAVANWSDNHIPVNPSGWIYSVAKNRLLNILKNKNNHLDTGNDSILDKRLKNYHDLDEIRTTQEMDNEWLRALLAVCHPSLTIESQTALFMKSVMGIKVREIAEIYITSSETISKRLKRARAKIRKENLRIESPIGDKIRERGPNALEILFTIYQLGYRLHSAIKVNNTSLCNMVCNMVLHLSRHPALEEKSNYYAVLALIYFNDSRTNARYDESANPINLRDQDRSEWDKQKIIRGCQYLMMSEPHQNLSKYHSLAIISAYHTSATSYEQTDWKAILKEYDILQSFWDTDIVRLNRLIIEGIVYDPAKAIKDIEAISSLDHYYLAQLSLGYLYEELGEFRIAINYYNIAISNTENDVIIDRIRAMIRKSKFRMKDYVPK